MNNTIDWNPKNRAILEQMWNDEKTDAEITEHFGARTYAVAKQRSIMGLVNKKMRVGIKRQSRSVFNIDHNYNIIAYQIDCQQHFSKTRVLSDEAMHTLANKLLIKNKNIRAITVLVPSITVTRNSIQNLQHIERRKG